MPLLDNIGQAVGDIVEQGFLEQLITLKNTLLGNGPSFSSQNEVDIKTMEYYLKVKALGLIFIGWESAQQIGHNAKTIKYYDEVDINQTAVNRANAEIQCSQGDIKTATYYGTTVKGLDEQGYNEKLPSFTNGATGILPAEAKDNAETFQLKDHSAEILQEHTTSYPEDELQKSGKENLANFLKTNSREINPTLKSLGLDSDSNFPKPNEDVATQDINIGFGLANKDFMVVVSGEEEEVFHKGWVKLDGSLDANTYSTPNETATQKIANMLEEYKDLTPGSYRFFIEKLHGVNLSGFNTKGPITPGLTRADLPNRMVFPAYIANFNDSYDVEWADYSFYGRGEKVWIYRNTQRELTIEFYMISDYSSELLLAAIEEAKNLNAILQKSTLDFISEGATLSSNVADNLSNTTFNAEGIVNTVTSIKNDIENVGVTSETKLSEIRRVLPDWGSGLTPFPTMVDGEYTGFVAGQYSGTPEMLWARLTFLAQCCYPWYRSDGKLKEQPFIRIRIGDFIDAVAKVNRLSLDEYEELGMDLNSSTVGAIPMAVKVTLNMTIIHENEPSSQSFRFYHRADFDGMDPSYVPDNASEVSKSLDSSLDNTTNNADASGVSLAEDPAGYMNSFESTLKKDQEAISNSVTGEVAGLTNAFNTSVEGLSNSGSSLKNSTFKEKFKESITFSKKILNIKNSEDVQKLKSRYDVAGGLYKSVNDKTLDFSTFAPSSLFPTLNK